MVRSTLSVRFQGLGADVDEKAKRSQERRKERKLRRQQRKMAQEENFQQARAFLKWLAQHDVDDGDDGGGGIFRNLSENVPAATAELTAILALPSGRLLVARAREKNYFHGDDDRSVVQALLANDCGSWKTDEVAVARLVAWALEAREAGHYLTYSYSSSSSEGGDRVEVDATRIFVVRDLGYYSDTFLAGTEALTEVCRLVASGDIDATTAALAKDLLGDNFQTIGPQDAGGVAGLLPAIADAILNRAATRSHDSRLQASAMWIVDPSVTTEQRRLVYNDVFGPQTVDHVSRASTSVEAAPASSM